MNTIVEWVLDLMDRIGGPGIALGIFLENVFPPIPSEVILPLAGFTAAQGRYSLVEAVLWATFGSVAGAPVLLSWTWLLIAVAIDVLNKRQGRFSIIGLLQRGMRGSRAADPA